MKKYILFTILLICGINGFAQYPILSNTSFANQNDEHLHTVHGNYAMDTANERDQYVGTWEYNQNGILFQVKIEKRDQYIIKIENLNYLKYSYADVVIFKYRLVKNGVEIFNNLNQTVFTDNDLISIATKQAGYSNLNGTFIDMTREVIGNVTITKLDTTPEKIIFKVPLGSYHLLNTEGYYNDGQPLFTFPTGGIEMVKVE